MIEPKDCDEGQTVYYWKPHMKRPEVGKISSHNLSYVFVRFEGELHGKACRREDLFWE